MTGIPASHLFCLERNKFLRRRILPQTRLNSIEFGQQGVPVFEKLRQNILWQRLRRREAQLEVVNLASVHPETEAYMRAGSQAC